MNPILCSECGMVHLNYEEWMEYHDPSYLEYLSDCEIEQFESDGAMDSINESAYLEYLNDCEFELNSGRL
jgi:hypothetical protein